MKIVNLLKRLIRFGDNKDGGPADGKVPEKPPVDPSNPVPVPAPIKPPVEDK